jgi:hypothetical protein
MTVLHAVGRFVYDFVIGDDWKIAAGVVAAMLVGALLLVANTPSEVIALVTTGLVGAAFAASMVIDVRRGLPR